MKRLKHDRRMLWRGERLDGGGFGVVDGEAKYALHVVAGDRLLSLPRGLSVPLLVLDGNIALEALPEDLDVIDLSMRGCVAFTRWPTRMRANLARLDLHGCTSLRSLPDALRSVVHLDVSGCTDLSVLPTHLRVHGSIELADTQLTDLPVGVLGAAIKWRGIPIPLHVALEPTSIAMEDIVLERNAERRRVLVERMGYERFIAESSARVLHRDQDDGGDRELIHVEIPGDEPLVCLSVHCPSTGQQYVLRVPPSMTHCHEAAAWIAGFDDPDDYCPIEET